MWKENWRTFNQSEQPKGEPDPRLTTKLLVIQRAVEAISGKGIFLASDVATQVLTYVDCEAKADNPTLREIDRPSEELQAKLDSDREEHTSRPFSVQVNIDLVQVANEWRVRFRNTQNLAELAEVIITTDEMIVSATISFVPTETLTEQRRLLDRDCGVILNQLLTRIVENRSEEVMATFTTIAVRVAGNRDNIYGVAVNMQSPDGGVYREDSLVEDNATLDTQPQWKA